MLIDFIRIMIHVLCTQVKIAKECEKLVLFKPECTYTTIVNETDLWGCFPYHHP